MFYREAEATRNALHGVQWPIGNGKKLIIEFGTTEQMEAARNPVVEPVIKPVPEKVPEKVNFGNNSINIIFNIYIFRLLRRRRRQLIDGINDRKLLFVNGIWEKCHKRRENIAGKENEEIRIENEIEPEKNHEENEVEKEMKREGILHHLMVSRIFHKKKYKTFLNFY